MEYSCSQNDDTSVLKHMHACIYNLSSYLPASIAPGDYTSLPLVTVFILSVATRRVCRNISITNDNVIENTESFNATISATSNIAVLSPDVARITIFDDGKSVYRVYIA